MRYCWRYALGRVRRDPSNWIACGQTKGFARHLIDYYRKHDRPAVTWRKVLTADPRVVVPMHSKTPYTGSLPLGRLDEFLKLNKDLPAKRLDEMKFAVTRKSLPSKPELWIPAVP